MNIIQLKHEFERKLNEFDLFDKQMNEFLSNDIHTLTFMKHMIEIYPETYKTVDDFLNDVGFVESCEIQYESPITFFQMMNE